MNFIWKDYSSEYLTLIEQFETEFAHIFVAKR